MARTNFEKLRVYQMSEELSDEIWWSYTGTVSREIPWANSWSDVDAIGANIAEGEGRGSYQDNRRFTKIARASLQETQHWLRRAFKRKLLTTEQVDRVKPLIDKLGPSLNAYLRSIGTTSVEANDKRPKARD